MSKFDTIIKKLDLQPHPEGGYYRETYRSIETIRREYLPNLYEGDRNISTCIYYLLTSGSYSAFHRIKQDEGWHFYDGSPVELHLLKEEGKYQCITLGKNFDLDEIPQYIIPGGTWFAASVKKSDSYSLVGCTVAPGFDFKDFEMAQKNVLLHEYLSCKKVIERFCREK